MQTELLKASKEFWAKQNKARIDGQRKLYDYYIGDEDRVLNYLTTALALTFNLPDINEFQLDWLNIARKIINQMAVIYKQSASRRILGKDNKADDKSTIIYNDILPVTVNSSDKQAHRFAKLFNTSLTRVKVINGKLVYEVLPSYLYDVKVDDNNQYKILEISYDKYIMNGNNDPELWTIFWTDDKHYRKQVLSVGDVTVHGDEESVGNAKGLTNPYKRVPFAACRLEEQGDFWGVGMSDLAKASEMINFLLTDLINGGIIMQSWGIPVLINTGYSKKAEKLRIGPKHPIAVDNPVPGVQVDAKFMNGSPMIKEVMSVIDWKIKSIALAKGLNPNSFVAEIKATSGFSKIVDALEQLEIRQDDIEPCRQFEEERFEVTKAVVNWHAKNDKECDLPEISEDSKLQTKFGDVEIPKSSDEEIRETEFELETGMTNIIAVMKKKNPDLDDKELEELIKKNQEINKRLNISTATLLQDAAKGGNPDSTGV